MSYDPTTVVPTIAFREERYGSPLQPEVILPAQFFAGLRGPASGERLLLIAILEDAINCFQKFQFATGGRKRRLFREAEQWIMEAERPLQDEDLHPYFSFEQVCNVLGLDPDYVRGGLQRWQRRQLVSVPQPALRLARRSPRRSAPRARKRGHSELPGLRVA